MNDYFFECSDARAELAGCRVVIENLIKALTEESNSDIFRNVSLEIAKEQVETINKILDKKIGE